MMTVRRNIDAGKSDLFIPGGRVGVLLIHGLGGSTAELRFVAQALARQGYTVYCPHLYGLGGGTDVSGVTTRQDWYLAVQEAHNKLCEICEIVLVGGLSAGSMLALKLAAERPQGVHGLFVYSPTFWPNGWAIPWYFNFFRLIRQKWIARLFHFRERPPYGIKDERIRAFALEALQGKNGRSMEDIFGRGGGLVFEFRWMAAEARKALSQVRQEVLVFHSRRDDQSALSNALSVVGKLPGRVELCVLDDCYHMITLDCQRNIVVDRTIDFATRVVRAIEDKEAVARMIKGGAVKGGASAAE